MKIICWVWSDGTILINTIAVQYRERLMNAGLSELEVIDTVIKKSRLPGEGVTYHIMEEDDLPLEYQYYKGFADTKSDIDVITQGRKSRAWKCDAYGVITCDMPKARGIQMTYIRQVRNAELAKLDVPFMRAIEAGDTSAQVMIVSEKQVLRDIPQTFDLTTEHDTPEELKQKWPENLSRDN